MIQDRLPLLGVSNSRQLHVPHFLHLLVHVNLLLQFLDFGAKQAHCVLSVMLAGDGSGTCRMDGCDPVLQLCLAAGLRGMDKGQRLNNKRATDIQNKKPLAVPVLIQ